MQVRTREHQGRACRRSVLHVTELRKPKLAPLVHMIQVQRDGQPSVCRIRANIVSMRVEESSIVGVIAGDLESLESVRLVDERALDLGQQFLPDRLCQQT